MIQNAAALLSNVSFMKDLSHIEMWKLDWNKIQSNTLFLFAIHWTGICESETIWDHNKRRFWHLICKHTLLMSYLCNVSFSAERVQGQHPQSLQVIFISLEKPEKLRRWKNQKI